MGSGLLKLAEGSARLLPEGWRLALYRLGPVTRALRGALTRAAPPGRHPVRVAAGDLAGCWLLLDLRIDKDLWLGTYEPQVAAAIRARIPPGAVAYDLGANLGYSSLLLAGAVGEAGQVFAFEPLEVNAECLRETIRLNGLEARVSVVRAAVGETAGEGTFLRHPSASMGRLAVPSPQDSNDSADREKVEVVDLDTFVYEQGQPAPSWVKIDIEGGEGAALRGMRRLLERAKPGLLVEIHGAAPAREVMQALMLAKYRAYTLGPRAVEIPDAAAADDALHLLGLPDGVMP
jgi:FkbM family methyltransferase